LKTETQKHTPESEGKTTIMVDPSQVWLDENNHRIKGGDDEGLLKSLAESIRRNGQQQPVKVVEEQLIGKGGTMKYRLVFGFRRHAACAMLGCKLWAEVMPAATEGTILELRALENLDRDSINPVEECLAVSKLYTAIEAGVAYSATSRNEIVAAISRRLGRPETWVRDRLYVHRLPAKVKDLVIQGILPLVYARELAKVADPGRCEQLAKSCLSYDKPPRTWRSLDWLKRQVEHERFSLRVVPWNVAAGFAGKGSCLDCPQNTANDMALFEHDGKSAQPEIVAPKGLDAADDRRLGVCTNKACHEAKSRAAQAAIANGLEKVRAAQKKTKDLGLGPAALAEAGLMPKVLKPSSFARAVGNELNRGKPTKKSVEDGEDDAPPRKGAALPRTPKERHQDAMKAWDHETLKAIEKGALQDTVKWAAVMLLLESQQGRDAFGYGKKPKATMELLKAVSLLTPTMQAKDLAAIVELLLPGPEIYAINDIFGHNDNQRAVVAAIATGLGVNRPMPRLEDFEKPDAKSANKKASKKAGKKGTRP
jgi:ParB/RepB/Spo0J family partition protein